MGDYPYHCVDKAPADMMYRAGEEMFNNELFSDAKVTANGYTWPIHKSIICSRSGYFSKAFTGPFREATTNQLTIEGQDAKAVGHVIYYLYTGDVPFYEVEDLREAVDLFIAADYFDIDHLRDHARNLLGCQFDTVLQYAHDKPLLDDEDLDQLFYAARHAYTSGPNLEALRKPIEGFLKETKFLLSKDDRFMRELNNIPEFALALIRLMSSPWNEEEMRYCCQAKPTWCTECASVKSKFAEISLVRYAAHDPEEEYVLVGTCSECFEEQQSE
ncbi:hypothetical protein PG994_004938 [Apiospora phragmitis]|uniref:BTB domain-containing protein n=1 Tax=Apiospora phragmitis TaxID=2905665 RepID=A0ABR1VS02_9PEZI